MKKRISFHKHAFACWLKRFPQAFLLSLSLLFAWGLFAAVLYLSIKHLKTAGLPLVALFAVILFVYRFFVTNRLFSIIVPDAPALKPVSALIPAALWRIFTAALWGAPFAALAYQFYRYYNVLPFTAISNDFVALGKLFSPSGSLDRQTAIGSIIFFSALIVSFCLLLYGWRRGYSFDLSQTKELTFRKSLRRARSIRHRSRSAAFSASLINAAFLLIAILIPAFLLLYEPLSQILPVLTGKIMIDLQLISAFLNVGFADKSVLILPALLFVVLYLPLLPFRKLHYTAAMVIRHE